MKIPQDKNKVHTFIVHVLSRKKLAQTDIANYLGITPAYVNQIIRGVKTDANARSLIAQCVGFKSWKELEEQSNQFWKDWEQFNLGIDFLMKSRGK